MIDLLGGLGVRLDKFSIGEECWIYVGSHGGERSKGTVIAVLDLPGYSEPHYVIEIPTAVDPLLEIRSGFSLEMSRQPSPKRTLEARPVRGAIDREAWIKDILKRFSKTLAYLRDRE